MRKIITAAALVCASLSLAAACARGTGAGPGDAVASAQTPPAQKQSEQKPREQKQATPPPGAQTSSGRPRVTEVKEDGLKSLLRAGEPRERPLLVNFWATWCGPCREEFPDLVKLRARYAAEQLDFALVSLDDASDIGTAVPDFLSESGAAALPAYLLHAEDDSAAINLVDPKWSGELPATFLYDRAGQIVFNHKGRIKPADLQAAIDKTLAAKPQAAGAQ
ncbi:MAG TPA: TlpA disulfide reductase family protein [Pyrinomonadaceae bacterium]|jgi:thiol-disulfide isomerase/thioredoxin|nr:TlpA disulfide reductase family protein [Pyrinomonadaceae bacterium]